VGDRNSDTWVVDVGVAIRGFRGGFGCAKWKVESSVVDGRDAWVGDRRLPPLASDV